MLQIRILPALFHANFTLPCLRKQQYPDHIKIQKQDSRNLRITTSASRQARNVFRKKRLRFLERAIALSANNGEDWYIYKHHFVLPI
ncbi:MAG: hypothetical protein ACTS85_04340 [Arsenophonus sp. NC-PG7-MAG3]